MRGEIDIDTQTKYDLGMKFYVTLGNAPKRVAELNKIEITKEGISYILRLGAVYWTLKDDDIDAILRGESDIFKFIEN